MASIKQAFVLGAGLGTRLRPLTDDLPKPLVPIFQKPLITFGLDHLIDIGIGKFLINTHRLPQAFGEAFPQDNYAGVNLKFVNEPVLLETGGGIKNLEADLGREPFITYSGDVLTDIRLQPLIDEHFNRGNDVTLALRKTGLGSAIAFRQNRVVDISNRYGIPGQYDFANIAVWSPSVFGRIPPKEKISFIPILGDWISQGGKIGGVVLEQGNWFIRSPGTCGSVLTLIRADGSSSLIASSKSMIASAHLGADGCADLLDLELTGGQAISAWAFRHESADPNVEDAGLVGVVQSQTFGRP